MLSQSSPTYGGQALLEGVMIRGKQCASIAVRRPDSTVALHVYPINPIFTGLFHRIPFIRGVFTLIETITLGMRALTYSAKVGMEEEGEEIGRMGMIGMVAFSLLFAIGLPDFFKKQTVTLPNIIPIEIINVTDTTSIPKKKIDIAL